MLTHAQIERLIAEQALLEGYVDLKTQLTPNGFDLTVEAVFAFDAAGAVDFSNQERSIPACRQLQPQRTVGEQHGWWQLGRGAYKVKTNETVNLPPDLVALAFSRTTLLRMGAFTQHGVWDAGFRGKGEFVLVVENPAGIRLKENARVAQLVFIPVEAVAKGYSGIFQGLK